MHPEIQPEMQPAFEFPGTHKKLHQGDVLMRIDWALGEVNTIESPGVLR